MGSLMLPTSGSVYLDTMAFILRFGPLDPAHLSLEGDDDTAPTGLTLEIIRERLKELDLNSEG